MLSPENETSGVVGDGGSRLDVDTVLSLTQPTTVIIGWIPAAKRGYELITIFYTNF